MCLQKLHENLWMVHSILHLMSFMFGSVLSSVFKLALFFPTQVIDFLMYSMKNSMCVYIYMFQTYSMSIFCTLYLNVTLAKDVTSASYC